MKRQLSTEIAYPGMIPCLFIYAKISKDRCVNRSLGGTRNIAPTHDTVRQGQTRERGEGGR